MRLCDRDIEAWLDEGRIQRRADFVFRPAEVDKRCRVAAEGAEFIPQTHIDGHAVNTLNRRMRLGNKFRTFSGHTAPFIDLSGPKDEVSAALDRVMSDEIVIEEGEAFYLHPGELAA